MEGSRAGCMPQAMEEHRSKLIRVGHSQKSSSKLRAVLRICAVCLVALWKSWHRRGGRSARRRPSWRVGFVPCWVRLCHCWSSWQIIPCFTASGCRRGSS